MASGAGKPLRQERPVLRAAAALEPAERQGLCVMPMHPNLYAVAEPLAEPNACEIGEIKMRKSVINKVFSSVGFMGPSTFSLAIPIA
jgi:hypothetical protein